MTATPTNNQLKNEDCGEFAFFDTFDSLAAYCHHKFGEEFLRQVFGRAFDPNDPPDHAAPGTGPKETLEETADKLEERGLDKPAAVLRDLAKHAISGIDLPPHYWLDNVEMWRSKWIMQRRAASGELWRDLERDRAKRDREASVNRQKQASHRH
jgi:hypothetical protein